MKKVWIGLLCAVMLLSAAACGDDTPTEIPGGTTSTTQQGEATNDATTTTTQQGEVGNTGEAGDKTTGTTPTAADNVVDFNKFFGDDTTTTTTGTTKKGETTKSTTTTTKQSTTTAPTTTKKPTTIDKVLLPAVGTDVDGKDRIAVSSVALSNGVLTLKLRNNTDKQKQKWITEETNYVTYACYDKNGKELKTDDTTFGYFYIGCLEAGKEVELKVTLPAGTAEVKLTGAKIVYWTPWS